MEETVDILMAVYNGETYVREQVNSILHQTYGNWNLIIQDDCSNDGTMDLLKPYAREYPERIVVKQREKNSGAAQRNFFSMLPDARNRYVMFCDHDDVWLPDKVERTLTVIREMEQRGAQRPLLAHTDLSVVDGELRPLAASMVTRQKLNPLGTFEQLLVQNAVTGCTMMVNRPLLDMVKEVPKRAIMHDWWFALIAAAFGEIGYANEPTILYRQHGGNQVGAKDASSLQYNMDRLKDQAGARKVLYDTCVQADEFLRIYRDRLDPDRLSLLSAYARLPEKGKCQRIATLCRYGLWKRGLARKLGQLIFI